MNNRNKEDTEAEEFQKLLQTLFGNVFAGTDPSANCGNPDAAKFMEDFQKGFSTGFAASDQYAQQTAPPENAQPIGFLPTFLFSGKSQMSLVLTRISLSCS